MIYAVRLNDIIFEWIPYDQFSDIKEIGRGGFATVYSAFWKDALLKYNSSSKKYTRKSNYEVALKCLHNSQDITAEFLREVGSFPFKVELNFINIKLTIIVMISFRLNHML